MLKRLELIFKAAVFGTAGLFLQKGRANPGALDPKRIRKILIIRPEKIGDMFVALPLIDRLRKETPGVKISLLTSRDTIPLVENDPRFDKIYIYRKDFQRDMENLFAMRDERYDVIIDLIGRDSVLFLIMGQMISKRAARIAVGKNKHRKYFDYIFDLRRGNTGHVIENTMQALDAFGLEYNKDDCYAPPYLSREDIKRAGEFLRTISHDGPLIGCNISAGNRGRLWPLEKYAELPANINTECGTAKFVLICTPSDRRKAIELKEKCPVPVEIVPDNLTLAEVSAIIRGLDCLITPDTSLVHIARSMRVPVVAIYARNLDNYKIWGPLGQKHGHVVSDDDDGIENVDVERVFEEFKLVMQDYVGSENAEVVGSDNYEQ